MNRTFTTGDAGGNSWKYAAFGFLLGTFAPLGWAVLRLVAFDTSSGNVLARLANNVFGTREHLALYLYMGLGTAIVLGSFGFFIGRSLQQMRHRAHKLDELHLEVATQKDDYENRFRDLNSNLKNFHASNSIIQKSVDPTEVIQLAADSLHDILKYDRVNILMLNADKSRLDFIASRGTENERVKGLSLPYDPRAGVLYKAISENRIFLVDDVRKMPDEYRLQPPCDEVVQLRSRSFIICPIIVSGEPIGLFGVDNKNRQKDLVDTDVDTVRLFANQVSSALTKIRLLEAMEQLMSELEKTFNNILRHEDDFNHTISSLREGSALNTETISHVSDAAQNIRQEVDDTSSAAMEISAAIRQVSQNLGRLNEFMDSSISAITEISSASQEVEKNADRSRKMATKVKDQAEKGVEMASQVYGGLQNVSEAVDRTIQVVEHLSKQSEEIDRIIAVINDINQKTHLLSLNASIIAAQAGDHGRSFAVVADEIRTLSAETTTSAEAIETLIQDIQRSTRDAVKQISDTRTKLDDGIHVGLTTAESLSEILESSGEAMQMADMILHATQEQVRSSRMVASSIEELGQLSAQVSTASREQDNGIQRIVQAITQIKSMAEEMAAGAASNEEQTRQTDDAVKSVTDMTRRIFAEMAEKKVEGHHLIQQLESLKESDIEVTTDQKSPLAAHHTDSQNISEPSTSAEGFIPA